MSSVDQNQPNSSREQKVVFDHDEDFPYSNGSNSSISTKEKTGGSSVKWTSSKMRLMRKFMRNTDQASVTSKMRSNNMNLPQNQEDSSNLIRVCSLCNTTKTPLWRGGPQGPKSLCNACGIRQRKARKAMAEAEEDAGRRTQMITNKCNGSGDKRINTKPVVSYKKRCTLFSNSEDDHEEFKFENLSVSLNRSSDVKEAAILLMALSSDITCG